MEELKIRRISAKSGAIKHEHHAHVLKPILAASAGTKCSVWLVAKAAVKIKVGKELPVLVEGLLKLFQSDPEWVCTTQECGEHVIQDVARCILRPA